MSTEVQKRRPPTRSKRDQDVVVEHLSSGGVVVRKDFPDDQRRKGLKVLVAVCLVLCLVPAMVWMLFGRTTGGRFAAGGSAQVTSTVCGGWPNAVPHDAVAGPTTV